MVRHGRDVIGMMNPKFTFITWVVVKKCSLPSQASSPEMDGRNDRSEGSILWETRGVDNRVVLESTKSGTKRAREGNNLMFQSLSGVKVCSGRSPGETGAMRWCSNHSLMSPSLCLSKWCNKFVGWQASIPSFADHGSAAALKE
jgi:hypothetical protein